MEYETRSIKWYWVLLFIIYSLASVYLLLKANPFLYAQGSLIDQQAQYKASKSLNAWPPKDAQFPMTEKASGKGISWPFLSFGNLNMTSPEVTRNKSYTEFKSFPLKAKFQGNPHIILQAKNELIVLDEDNWVYNFNNIGELRWSYGLSKEAELLQTLKDSSLLYLIRKNGSVTALELEGGRPQWILEPAQNIVGEAWLENESLILPVEKVEGKESKKNRKKVSFQFLQIDRNDGSLKTTSDGFDFKEAFKEVLLPGTEHRLLYSGAQIIAIPQNFEVPIKTAWQTTLPESIARELVFADGRIFATTEGKRLYVLNGKKKGDTLFDIDLDIFPGGAVTYLPEMDRLAYLGESGILRVVDLKKKEMAWKFDLSIKGPLRSIWSSRLKGAYIQEFGMRWVYKGWTLWSPCRAKAFCVYNPERGQLIQRIELTGTPLSLPYVAPDKIYAPVKLDSGELAVAHLYEPTELRKAQAEEEAKKAALEADSP